jgi:hypothetical protein
MKKVLSKIGDFFVTLLGVLLVLIIGVCFIVVLPLDYIKYKRSLYYKTEHKKYRLFAASGIYFRIFNEIIKNDLPIEYYYNPNNDSLECGWFVFDKTLIIPDAALEYVDDDWIIHIDNDGHDGAILSLTDFLEGEIKEANELIGETVCEKAIVLLNEYQTENIVVAKNDNRLIVYEDDVTEALKAICL